MRYILLCVLIVIFIASCTGRPMKGPDSGSGSLVDTTASSASGNSSGTTHTSRPARSGTTVRASSSASARTTGSSMTTIGSYQYSVIETTAGFAVLKLDSKTHEVMERADYVNDDLNVYSLANPRISARGNNDFTVALTAVKNNAQSTVQFSVSTDSLSIAQK